MADSKSPRKIPNWSGDPVQLKTNGNRILAGLLADSWRLCSWYTAMTANHEGSIPQRVCSYGVCWYFRGHCFCLLVRKVNSFIFLNHKYCWVLHQQALHQISGMHTTKNRQLPTFHNFYSAGKREMLTKNNCKSWQLVYRSIENNITKQESVTFFFKWPDGKYFRHHNTYWYCCNFSALPLEDESSHRQCDRVPIKLYL
jgi:hypothetical protein